jgi:DNA-binding LacI/PurR family transcriptional regulator
MVTIHDVAREARASAATVSNVINRGAFVSDRLRQRVLRAMKRLNYHPNEIARSLRTKSTRTLGMIIPDITNPFFPGVVRGAEDAAIQHRYTLVLCNSDNKISKELEYLRMLRAKRVDGILLILSPESKAQQTSKTLKELPIPVVCLDRAPDGARVDLVVVDNVTGASRAVEHLLQMGHREIAILTGPLDLVNARERLEGYKRALAKRSISVLPGFVQEGDFDIASGARLGRKLINLYPRPTAIFSSNNLMTLGLLKAIRQARLRSPEDIAVVSFDDLPWWEWLYPSISAVAQPAYRLGAEGATLLINRIQEKRRSPVVQKSLPTKLIVRESSNLRLSDGSR